MKILEIRLKNLNSLTGEWSINLAHPQYENDGIFAITGPTGAGKTTIFDAVCLALYGRTPRLGNITSKTNEIMSRRKGECYAKIKFSNENGVFWCFWEQRRAYCKSDGNLQETERSLIDALTGKTIATRLQTSVEVEKITGMDFNRFTRAMLLAQGNFDTFLKAGKNERAEILELITGTEIYSQISQRVYRHLKIEQLNLADIKNRIETITHGENTINEKNLQRELEQLGAEHKKLESSLDENTKARDWLRGISELNREISSLKKQNTSLEKELQDFEPFKLRLKAGLRAKDISESYSLLASLRKTQNEELDSLREKERKLPELERQERENAARLQEAQEKYGAAKEKRDGRTAILTLVRSIDQQIKTKYEERQNSEVKGRGISREYKDLYNSLLKSKNELNIASQNRKSRLKGISIAPETLMSEAMLLIKKFEECSEEKKRRESLMIEAKASLEKSRCAFSTASKNYKIKQDNLMQATDASRKAVDKLNELLNRERKAVFEEERANLLPGVECPLCGSREHPGIAHSHSVSSQTVSQLKNLIEQADKAVKENRAEEDIKHGDFINAHEKLTEASANESSDEKNYEQCVKEFDIQSEALTQVLNELQNAVKPAGIDDVENKDIAQLRHEMKAWVDGFDALNKRVQYLESECIRLDSMVKSKEEQLISERRNYSRLNTELEVLQKERLNSYGNGSPDDEERFLKSNFDRASEFLELSRREYDIISRELGEARITADDLRTRTAKRKSSLDEIEKNFSDALRAKNFSDETSFVNARLDDDELESLQAKFNDLEARKNSFAGQLSNREKKLADEIAKDMTRASIEELESKIKVQSEKLSDIQLRTGELNGNLTRLQEHRGKLESLKKEYEAQERTTSRWQMMNSLIGSESGNNYRVFAQKLTLRTVVDCANVQLKKMNGRYSLITTPGDDSLALSVIDNDQAGEIRPTKNLSGGESFVISLALALGLSQISGSHTKVDSLFLDEGFGSLDEDALEAALNALGCVQREGHMIGIISHVQALKERIATQIQVIPKSYGESEIKGPGCERLSH